MPELPEVETVRRGLEPRLVGATVTAVSTMRSGLRYPFPASLPSLVGRSISSVERRSKYLLLGFDDGRRLLSHLGMTGRFKFGTDAPEKHDHFAMRVQRGEETIDLVYNDARRFGFMQLLDAGEEGRFLEGLGPEPLSPLFDGGVLHSRLQERSAPLKTALMDQRIVAGIGNIYACELLFRTGISPIRPASAVSGDEASALARAIKEILEESIVAGGSTLKDYRKADGGKGSFQDRFDVYGKEGGNCPRGHGIVRIQQGGRSTFYCPVCQCA